MYQRVLAAMASKLGLAEEAKSLVLTLLNANGETGNLRPLEQKMR
jgi:hypothetical protein